ncbi:MAG TPA: OsmC family protein [Polyangiaceae bacterium]|nr:OsmC family protein [Polyangiaceae bacterium]
MSVSKATARWEGTLKEGRGSMKPAHGEDVPFSLGTRFAGEQGSNPEEMIGAALAGCFSMALAANLGKAGLSPQSVNTSADVSLDKDGEGFTITNIRLSTKAKVPGLDAAKFQSIAEETKKTCPVSKALAGPRITLEASLE